MDGTQNATTKGIIDNGATTSGYYVNSEFVQKRPDLFKVTPIAPRGV